MLRYMATEEFIQALKLGQKEYKEASAAGKQLHPLVLDELLSDDIAESVIDVGLVDIPAERIVGVKASGGVRTKDAFLDMVNAGASRVGSSSSVQIMKDLK